MKKLPSGAKRIVLDALFAAVALSLFVIELMIPLSVGIPGVKLGLANIVTVVAVFLLSPVDAAGILYTRILLGGVFSGQAMALLYSLAGGTLCFIATLVLKRFVTEKQIWAVSVIGSLAHNLGQTLVAAAVLRTGAVFLYLPVLFIAGILAGLFTGVSAQILVSRLGGVFRARYENIYGRGNDR